MSRFRLTTYYGEKTTQHGKKNNTRLIAKWKLRGRSSGAYYRLQTSCGDFTRGDESCNNSILTIIYYFFKFSRRMIEYSRQVFYERMFCRDLIRNIDRVWMVSM